MISKRIKLAIAAAAVVTVGGTAVALGATGIGSSNNNYHSYMYRMMGSGYAYQPSKSVPVSTLAGARADAQRFADRLGLKVAEVLRFQENFYAKLVDSRGNGATEVLVDPQSGLVSIEYGPAMMWNTRYGMGRAAAWMMGSYGESMMRDYGGAMMGAYGYGSATNGGTTATTGPGYGYGMMGADGYGTTSTTSSGNSAYGYGGMMGGYGYNGAVATTSGPRATSGAKSVSMAQAHTLAQRWLDANEPGVEVETGGDAFPGYYTLETLRNGRITGMISVNATNGAVWPHWWHGVFISKWEA